MGAWGGPGRSDYAAGWMIERRGRPEAAHSHGGSALSFYALVRVTPGQNRAIVVAMNSGAISNQAIADRIIAAIE